MCNLTIYYYCNILELTMKKMPRISEAEWQVMRTLWRKSPQTANDIVKVLSKRSPWKRETIRTLINRLVRKKALDFEKKGRQYYYFPTVVESECVRAEIKSFLRRFHGGSIEPMLAAFVESEKLSAKEIARLKQILDGKAAMNAKKGGKKRSQ